MRGYQGVSLCTNVAPSVCILARGIAPVNILPCRVITQPPPASQTTGVCSSLSFFWTNHTSYISVGFIQSGVGMGVGVITDTYTNVIF